MSSLCPAESTWVAGRSELARIELRALNVNPQPTLVSHKMSLKYGLNTKKAAPASARRPILDDEDDEDDAPQNGAYAEAAVEDISTFGSKNATSPPSSRPRKPAKPPSTVPSAPPSRKRPEQDRQDLSSAHASASQIAAASTLDAKIFDYDAFHDAKTTVSHAQKEADRADALARKPRYIGNLLDAAARRKKDQLVAKEKLLQREREEEGDEFKDKEKFVTGAYKAQQAEAREVEAEEKRKTEAEEERRRKAGGGMQGFYRGMMDERERQHREAVEAAERVETEGGAGDVEGKGEKSDAQLAAEAKAKGVNVHVNEEGQITDKRELLTAGLNVGSGNANSKDSGRGGADHLKTSNRPGHQQYNRSNDGGKQAQRERQSKMMEEQLAAQAKRAREEEEEERARVEKAAKSQKTAGDVSDAKARYLARKAAKERGEG